MRRLFRSRVVLAVVAIAVWAASCAAIFVFWRAKEPTTEAATPQAAAEPPALSEKNAELARKGDLEALVALSNQSLGGWEDAQAYKWLVAAEDFGHRAATAHISDLLEISSLRYDDGNHLTSSMHYELAMDYLTGGEGLPFDLAKARKNLALSVELGGIQDIDMDFAADRQKLSGDALRVYDEEVPASLRKEGSSPRR